jgi:hypothetical protein
MAHSGSYLVVFLTIAVCYLLTLGAHVLLKSRIDYQLLADGVAREFPDELVPKALLMVMVSRVYDLIVVLFQLAVVLDDSIRDGR